jgi:spore protease
MIGGLLMTSAPQVSSSYIDLAVEAHALLRGESQTDIDGVEERVEQLTHSRLHHIIIRTAAGADVLNRPVGSYVTIESPPLKLYDVSVKNEIVTALAAALGAMIRDKVDLQPDDTVLLVGLGNWRAAADAVGPKFIACSPVTRQFSRYAPQALPPGTRPCCGIAPGVLGATGLETSEVVRGIVNHAHPALIIVADALAANNVDRIGCTIQLGNTGIQPGSGIGNARQALNQETLGVPVIALGCPTIVNASVIARQLLQAYGQSRHLSLDSEEIAELIRQSLAFHGGDLAVTPKEIDDIAANSARIMADGVAAALFPHLSPEDIALYIP